MGEVYRARDPRLNRQVAIKLLPGELAADPHARERLRREAMAVAAIDHPYICKIFEIGEDGDALFLVMEYIAGDTLHRRLQDGPAAAVRCPAVGRRDRRGAPGSPYSPVSAP
jgi:serine/threonine protein kinase